MGTGISDRDYCPIIVRAREQPAGWRGEIWLLEERCLWRTPADPDLPADAERITVYVAFSKRSRPCRYYVEVINRDHGAGYLKSEYGLDIDLGKLGEVKFDVGPAKIRLR